MDGAFALVGLSKDEFLIEYRGALYYSQAVDGTRTFLGDPTRTAYVIEVRRLGRPTKYIDARDPASRPVCNWSWAVNTVGPHYASHQLNVIFVQEHGRVYLRALRDIQAGEELLANYLLPGEDDNRVYLPGSPLYAVEKFVGRRVVRCRPHVCVRWLGYTEVADTWEPETHMIAWLGKSVYRSLLR
jgi:hypothetical protein